VNAEEFQTQNTLRIDKYNELMGVFKLLVGEWEK